MRQPLFPPSEYNIFAIRKLLNEAFNEHDFTLLCYDHFQTVYQKFEAGMAWQTKIGLLLDECAQNNLFEDLLKVLKALNLKSEAELDRLWRNPVVYSQIETIKVPLVQASETQESTVPATASAVISFPGKSQPTHPRLNWLDTLHDLYQRSVAPYYLPRLLLIMDNLKYQLALLDDQREVLKRHQRHLNGLEIWSAVLLAGLSTLCFILITILMRASPSLSRGSPVTIALAYGLYTVGIIVHRGLLIHWLARPHVESVVVGALVYTLKVLEDEKVLNTLAGKRRTQRYLHLVATSTLHLGRVLPTTTPQLRNWALNWMEHVAAHIYKLETWVLTPQAHTVQNLRANIAPLLPIYLSGQYDDFRYIIPDIDAPLTKTKRPPLKPFFGYLAAIGLILLIRQYGAQVLPLSPEWATALILIFAFRALEIVTGAGMVELIKALLNKHSL